VPGIVAVLLESKLATLHELDTVYGTEDMWDLLEVCTVHNYNERVSREEK
jgi:hypothetical protein